MHGTISKYARGCRCPDCKAAQGAYDLKRRTARKAGTWVPYANAAIKQTCSLDGCNKMARYNTPAVLCRGHYQQWINGRPFGPLRQYNYATDGVKRCTRCDEVKSLTEFTPRGKHYAPNCRACQSIVNRCNLYGLTFNEVVELLRQPCSGCGASPTEQTLHVDHNHDTGVVRGMLCHNCNTTLTRHMTPATLRRLADYLEKFG